VLLAALYVVARRLVHGVQASVGTVHQSAAIVRASSSRHLRHAHLQLVAELQQQFGTVDLLQRLHCRSEPYLVRLAIKVVVLLCHLRMQ
jgi:hypothetical protein